MHLNCHSYYSFLYGTMKPAELVKRGKAAGASTLVLTEINNTAGWYDFLIACNKEGIKPLLGVDFRHESRQRFIAIAKCNEGIYAINKYLTEYSQTKQYEKPPVSSDIFLIYPLGERHPADLAENEMIGIRAAELSRLYDASYLTYGHKLVILSAITFKDAADYDTHRALRAIDQNTLLSKLEVQYIARSDEYFTSIQQVEEAFAAYPHIIRSTQQLLSACHISIDLCLPKNKKSFTGSKTEDIAKLKQLATEGFTYRYGNDHPIALERLHKEFKIIEDLDFAAYYLITWDIICYAGSRGFRHVGRGSGANSIVAYCLKITDVDPIALNLYFERFINPYRTSPPDFDIDFSWDERDEVIDYIFKKYGREHVCLLATFNTFGSRSIIREMGKIHGLPTADIDQLVHEPHKPGNYQDLAEKIFEMVEVLDEFPDHLSIHAGGILITEESLYYQTALEMMPKGFPVCQFDMHVAESWGFYKYDVLSQRGLGHIKEAVDIIRKNRGVEIDIHRTKDFFEDPHIRERLLSARTIGCFYIESPAMRGLLSKLRCDNFLSLVAASSIIRPGVAKSGMMREYIMRSNYPDKITYIHPKFKEVLEETHGVMVYQEDVIKIAHHFAGLDLGEADILRRGMSGKSRTKQEFITIQTKYYENCRKLGYPDELAKEVWRQIESFSGFSFCKAHSASYAVESYQSLFLKTYYPLEFMVAVINNFGGFYYTELYVHEARVSGADIEAPCVNEGAYKTSIKGKTIYLGFIHVQSLESAFAQSIIAERISHGPYRSLYDFVRRVRPGKEQLNLLIRIGAFRFTGKSKQNLLWEKNNYLHSKMLPATAALLDEEPEAPVLPPLEIRPYEDVFDQMDLLGFPLCSPFDLLRHKDLGEIIYVEDMRRCMHKTVRMVGYFVAKKDTRTSHKELMNFGTWVDSKGLFFDSVHFPPQLKAYPFTGRGCYLLLGKIVHDFDFPSIEVQKMIRLPIMTDPRY